MSRVEASLTRLTIIVASYVAASFVACTFISLILFFRMLAVGEVGIFLVFVLIGALYSTCFTAIPSAVAVLLLEIFAVRSKWIYLIGGAAVAAVALVLADQVIHEDFRTFLAQGTLTVIGGAIGGGCVGGFVYWLLAGERAGDWHLKGQSSHAAPNPPLQ